jgi:hypothetical protein
MYTPKLARKHYCTRLYTTNRLLYTRLDACLASKVTSPTGNSCPHNCVHKICSDRSLTIPSSTRLFSLNSILDRLRYPSDAPFTCILHALQRTELASKCPLESTFAWMTNTLLVARDRPTHEPCFQNSVRYAHST